MMNMRSTEDAGRQGHPRFMFLFAAAVFVLWSLKAKL